jgi:UDP-glucose 4-epimerase
MSLTHAHDAQDPTRVVVLGAGGFLGRGVLAACAHAGMDAVGIGSRDIDLADAAAGTALGERLRPKDVVVFLAAVTPDRGRDTATLMRNLAIGRSVCEAARSVDLAQLVYASSDAVYSFATSLISEETPAVPVDLYGAMHRTRELMLLAEVKAPLAIVRPTAVYGAGDTHNSYGPNRFVRQLLTDARIQLFGNGEETRDHLYIDDTVALLLAIIRRGSSGLVNLASGKSHTFRALADLIVAQAGQPAAVEPSERRHPATHRHFDITNLLRAFPAVRLTPIERGVTATLAAMRGQSHG